MTKYLCIKIPGSQEPKGKRKLRAKYPFQQFWVPFKKLKRKYFRGYFRWNFMVLRRASGQARPRDWNLFFFSLRKRFCVVVLKWTTFQHIFISCEWRKRIRILKFSKIFYIVSFSISLNLSHIRVCANRWTYCIKCVCVSFFDALREKERKTMNETLRLKSIWSQQKRVKS